MRGTFRLWLILILCILSVRITYAQDAQLWYFAIGNLTSNDKQSIVAYTDDGTINTLIEGEIDFNNRRQWRIASDAMLGIYNIDGEIDFYYATSNSIQRLNVPELFKVPSQARSNTPYAWNLTRRSPNYVLLEYVASLIVNNEYLSVLINLETLAVETIIDGGEIHSPRFSEDEHYLRYMIDGDDTDEETCSLVEKDLIQDTEQILVTQPRFYGNCSTASPYGDYWLIKIRTYRLSFDREFQLFSISGENEFLPDPDEMEYAIYDDEYVWAYAIDCEINCDLMRRSLSSGEINHYVIPNRTLHAKFILPLYQYADASVLIIIDTIFWLLHPDGNAEIIGYVSLGMMGTNSFPNGLLSPDDRWLLVATTADDFSSGYRIWDSENQQHVLEHENGPFIIWMNYQYNGFILSEIRDNERIFKFYRHDDKKFVDLPVENGIYIDVLSDGKILYNGEVDAKALPLGIYSYDIDQNAYELIIQNAFALTIPPTPSEPLLPGLLDYP
jgi:hypothetical protein